MALLAPQVRLELTTLRLTAECSAIELLRNIFSILLFSYVREREKLPFLPLPVDPGNFLLSQAVPSSVPSAFGGLTSVFGMGTGGALQLSSPETFPQGSFSLAPHSPHLQNCTAIELTRKHSLFQIFRLFPSRSPRPPLSRFLRFLRLLFDGLPFSDQALDRLVSASSTPHSASTADLSTSSSLRGLTCFMQWQSSSSGGLHA